MKKGWIAGTLAVLLVFLLALARLETGYRAEGKQQLENAVRRTVTACYAAEGAYPPDIGYLQAHYGLQWEESKYVIRYARLADNLMPEITVLEK